MSLTSAERLRHCYFHEELDRPGIYFRTGFPADDPTYDRVKALIRETTDLKFGWSGITVTPQPAVRYEREPLSADFERVWAILETPAGELRSSRLASLKGQPGMTETHFIKDSADAEKYLSLPRPQVQVAAASFAVLSACSGDVPPTVIPR